MVILTRGTGNASQFARKILLLPRVSDTIISIYPLIDFGHTGLVICFLEFSQELAHRDGKNMAVQAPSPCSPSRYPAALEPGAFSESHFLYLASDLGGCHEGEVEQYE